MPYLVFEKFIILIALEARKSKSAIHRKVGPRRKFKNMHLLFESVYLFLGNSHIF